MKQISFSCLFFTFVGGVTSQQPWLYQPRLFQLLWKWTFRDWRSVPSIDMSHSITKWFASFCKRRKIFQTQIAVSTFNLNLYCLCMKGSLMVRVINYQEKFENQSRFTKSSFHISIGCGFDYVFITRYSK